MRWATWVRVGILAAIGAFYVWTSATSQPLRFTPEADGIHGQIANAFLHGRLYLADAPPALTDLSDPYDPAQSLNLQRDLHVVPGGPRIHDLSFYEGKLYAYWGPVPALVLFAPARLLGVDFPESLAIALFAFLAFLFAMFALLALQRRFAPHAAPWRVNTAILCLGLANALPCMIRRTPAPSHYQVTIAAAACFALLATWLLVTALLAYERDGRPDLRRLALVSLALGLAVGTRPSHVVTVAGLLMLAAWWLRGIPRSRRTRVALALLGPLSVCGVLLLVYNYGRFHSITEFGLTYQLAAVDVTTRDSFSLSYLLPGLWYYLVAPPRLSIVFPFLKLAPSPTFPGRVPAVYDGVEPIAGLLVLAPIVLLLVIAPFRRRLEAELRAVLLALLGIAAGLIVIASVAFWGVTMRYEVDFASFLLIGGLVSWLRARGRWAAIAGTTVIAWSSIVAVALSFGGESASLHYTHPKLWHALANDFGPVSRLIARVGYGGPVIAEVSENAVFVRDDQGFTTLVDQRLPMALTPLPTRVVVVMPSGGVTHLRLRMWPGTAAVPGSPLALVIQLPDDQIDVVEVTGGDQEVDVPVPLPGGVQVLSLRAVSEAPPQGSAVLEVRDLRVEGLERKGAS